MSRSSTGRTELYLITKLQGRGNIASYRLIIIIINNIDNNNKYIIIRQSPAANSRAIIKKTINEMKTIKINNQNLKCYESFEEAANNSKRKDTFVQFAKDYKTEFLKACEATGVASLIWMEDHSFWAGVSLSPYVLVDGVVMGHRHTSGPKSNCYFYDIDYVCLLDGDKWDYDQPKPNNVGKPTAKALKAWAKYLKEKHAAIIAHKNELLQQRAATREKSLKILKKAGFVTYFEREKFEEAKEFECVRGAIKCHVTLGHENEIHKTYQIDYCAAIDLFSDVK